MSARDTILNHLRTRTDGAIPVPECDFSVMTGRGWSHEERLARFEQLITSVHAEVVHTQHSNWTQALAVILHDKNIKRLALGNEHPVASDARTGLAEAGVELVDAAREIETWQREQFERVDAGLTSTGGAIAETGSLWLWPTPDEPRRLSLVPSIHIAVLDSDAIEETFFDVIEARGWARAMPTNALLVSGPSKTADIEQTLAYGVHGPKELVVIVRHADD
jgi:L-lactate dehydrogenase complex protein LldG